MKVGYARVDITPRESVPMAGYSNNTARMSRIVLDPLYGTVIAFEDEGGRRALVCTVDMINAGLNCTDEVRPAMAKATGIPVELIHVSGIHTHAGPGTESVEAPSMRRFRKYYARQMAAAAAAAVADLAPARLALARTETESMNFVRHYRLSDGTYVRSFHSAQSPVYVGHESEPDRTMQLAKICRKGRPDIVLCNFQVHQTDTGGSKKTAISADVAGAMRSEAEKRGGWQFAYFTGASGNLNPVSAIPEENVIPPLDHVAHGKALARYALAAADAFAPASFGPIRAMHAEHRARIDHSTDGLTRAARKITDHYAAHNDLGDAMRLAQDAGFHSVFHAEAVQARAKMPEDKSIPADVLSVGDLAFAVAGYEMFDTHGMQIKRRSPFKMTMVLTTADTDEEVEYYLPTRINFRHGSYAADTCPFGPEVGEEMAGLYADMLNKIAEKE